ncbi:LysE family translocator [Arthrobacter sp. GCM10027362]|uniref:LysE family translocator n=1 Tax=Arthrobacter sp. GCM10027362 TaxID=3273379 RepID=UPI00363F8979
MPPLPNLLAFAVTAFVLIAVPGPSVLFVIGRSLALGRRGGLLSVLGNALGMLPQILATAIGLGTAAAQSATVFTVIKFLGAGYLAYLGIQAIRHRRQPPATAPAAVPRSMRRLLREGFLVGATNPKSLVFFVAVLPQFVSVPAGSVPLQLAVLGLVFLVIALVCDSMWALAAGTARDWFARSPGRISALRAAGGTMMIALGGLLALAARRT